MIINKETLIMKKKFYVLLVPLVCSFSAFSNEEDTGDLLYKADVDTVASIHDYCSSQVDENGEAQSESVILTCINNDLDAAAYQTFSSYHQVKSLLKSEKGE